MEIIKAAFYDLWRIMKFKFDKSREIIKVAFYDSG